MLLVGTAFADPIHDAARNGDLAGVQAQLDAGADVNAKLKDGTTPLHEGASYGRKEIAELLISDGADVNAKRNISVNGKDRLGLTPLDHALTRKLWDTADLLRKHGGKTTKELEAEGAK